MKFIIFQYLCAAVAFAYEGNWTKMHYFIGAIWIGLSVLWMK